jgi:hypothetical protein
MPWESLRKSLNRKPQVLADLLLRQVTPKRVSVWLALREPCSMTLKVLYENGNRAMTGTQQTVAIGLDQKEGEELHHDRRTKESADQKVGRGKQ